MWHFTRLPLSHCAQSLLPQVNYCTLTNDSYSLLAWPDAAMGHDDILLASWPKSSLEKQWKWQNQTQTTKTQVHFSSQDKDKGKMFRKSCGFFALLLKCLVSVQTVLETTVRTRAMATPLGNRESIRKVVSTGCHGSGRDPLLSKTLLRDLLEDMPRFLYHRKTGGW